MNTSGVTVYTLEMCDDSGGVAIGVYTTKRRALAALRHETGKARFAALTRCDSKYNPDWHQFYVEDDDDGTFYRIDAHRLDQHA